MWFLSCVVCPPHMTFWWHMPCSCDSTLYSRNVSYPQSINCLILWIKLAITWEKKDEQLYPWKTMILWWSAYMAVITGPFSFLSFSFIFSSLPSFFSFLLIRLAFGINQLSNPIWHSQCGCGRVQSIFLYLS